MARERRDVALTHTMNKKGCKEIIFRANNDVNVTTSHTSAASIPHYKFDSFLPNLNVARMGRRMHQQH